MYFQHYPLVKKRTTFWKLEVCSTQRTPKTSIISVKESDTLTLNVEFDPVEGGAHIKVSALFLLLLCFLFVATNLRIEKLLHLR